jgi:hypothetical protein
LTRQAGQVKKGDVEQKKSTSFSKEAQAEFRRKELQKLEALKADIEKMIEQSRRNWRSSKSKCCSTLLRKVCAYKLSMSRTGLCLIPVAQTSNPTPEKFCARSASH